MHGRVGILLCLLYGIPPPPLLPSRLCLFLAPVRVGGGRGGRRQEVRSFQGEGRSRGCGVPVFRRGLLRDGQRGSKDEFEAYAYWSLAATSNNRARSSLTALEADLTSSARLFGQQRAKDLQKEIEDNIVASKTKGGWPRSLACRGRRPSRWSRVCR